MRLFGGKPKKEEEKKPEDRTHIHKRLYRIKKGEKLERTKETDVDYLVEGLADGDG